MDKNSSYYSKHKAKLKQRAIQYYKKNKLLIKNNIKRDDQLYEWYINDMSNNTFKIRHGIFYYHEDHTDIFKKT